MPRGTSPRVQPLRCGGADVLLADADDADDAGHRLEHPHDDADVRRLLRSADSVRQPDQLPDLASVQMRSDLHLGPRRDGGGGGGDDDDDDDDDGGDVRSVTSRALHSVAPTIAHRVRIDLALATIPREVVRELSSASLFSLSDLR